MIRVGIIGCGKIAQIRHIPEYEEEDGVEIAGVYDLNRERAESIAKEHGGRAYASYEEMLADDSIDAVSVCTANHVHAEITIAALKAGKHVLCEKPMGMTLKECEDMVKASEENQGHLMIGHNQRFTKAHRKAKALIEQGEIGDILTFKTNFSHGGPETWSIDPGKQVWFFDKDKAVLGAMADLGIHKTDLIHFLTGSRITEVFSMMSTLDKRDASGELIGVDDNVICLYRLENGVQGSMTVSWTCYGEEDNSTILYGTKGVMKIYCSKEHSIVIEHRDKTTSYYDMESIQTNDNQTRSGIIKEFIRSIRTGTPPETDGKEALGAMKAIFASVESDASGKRVKISGEVGK